MDSIKSIFYRMNPNQIQQFLLYGAEDLEADKRPYMERLKEESAPILNRLRSIYPEGDAQDKATAELYQALNIYEAVFMELGMKAGARLIHQLLFVDD